MNLRALQTLNTYRRRREKRRREKKAARRQREEKARMRVRAKGRKERYVIKCGKKEKLR